MLSPASRVCSDSQVFIVLVSASPARPVFQGTEPLDPARPPDYVRLRVTELKALLRARSLTAGSRKADIVSYGGFLRLLNLSMSYQGRPLLFDSPAGLCFVLALRQSREFRFTLRFSGGAAEIYSLADHRVDLSLYPGGRVLAENGRCVGFDRS